MRSPNKRKPTFHLKKFLKALEISTLQNKIIVHEGGYIFIIQLVELFLHLHYLSLVQQICATHQKYSKKKSKFCTQE